MQRYTHRYSAELLLLCIMLLSFCTTSCETSPVKPRTDVREPHEMGPIIGIDIGSTYSRVASAISSNITVIADDFNNTAIPSYVAFHRNGSVIVGEDARLYQSICPQNTIFDIKDYIGRPWANETVQKSAATHSFNVRERDGKPFFRVSVDHEKQFFGINRRDKYVLISPEEAYGHILNKLRVMAETRLNATVTHAVITVPSNFTDNQRDAIRASAGLAGLIVVRIMNEPTAALIAYISDQRDDYDERYHVVVNIGGNNIEVTVIAVENGVYERLEERHEEGGMANMTYQLQQYAENTNHGGEPEPGFNLDQFKLSDKIMQAVKVLSVNDSATLDFADIAGGLSTMEISREKFQEINHYTFNRVTTLVNDAVISANLSKANIENIYIVGGGGNVPRFKTILEGDFKNSTIVYQSDILPEEAVVIGAAIQARVVGSATSGDDHLVGAFEIARFTYGIELADGIMETVYWRHRILPTRKTKSFTVARLNQTSAHISIYRGGRPLSKQNTFLGRLEIGNLSQHSTELVELQVALEIEYSETHIKVSVTESSSNRTMKAKFEIDNNKSFSVWKDYDKAWEWSARLRLKDLSQLYEVQSYTCGLEADLQGVVAVYEVNERRFSEDLWGPWNPPWSWH